MSDAGETPPRVWVTDRSWRVLSPAEPVRYCRQPTCSRRAVAALRRRHGAGWREWAYCDAHLYGRRIAGHIEVDVHPDSPAAERGYVE